MTEFTLASLLIDGAPVPAIGLRDGFHPLPEALRNRYPTTKAIFEQWEDAFPALQAFADDAAVRPADDRVPADRARFDIPIRFPNKAIAAGANFRGHLEEMGLPVKKYDPLPVYLMPPTTCLVGPGRTVRKPRMTNEFDWEIELTIVIGRRLTEASLEEAAAGIAGYTIALDLSARDLNLVGPPFHLDFVRSKCQDTMTPIGPVILPKAFLDSERGLQMQVRINDKLTIDSNTSEMIFEIPEIIAYLSRFITLEPGDVVLTGSPEGSGAAHGFFLQPGDRISGSIDRIGTLDVEVMA